MVLTVGLSADVTDDRAYLDRLAPVDASFTFATAILCRHTFSNTMLPSSSVARADTTKMVNEDLGLWVNDLMRFAEQILSVDCFPSV